MSLQTARGKHGAVVSGHQSATGIALDVLQTGGNVVDAAVAGAAALAVALPHACGLGGDCFILAHIDGKTYALNGSGRSPSRLPAGLDKAALSTGPLSSAVPGMLGAWDALHQRFGSRPWAELLSPAVVLAKNGIDIASDFANAITANRDALERDPGCKALFLDETVMSTGRLVQPCLAETLAQIVAERSPALYKGDIGAKLCLASQERGGVLHVDDLAAYAPVWATPLHYRYRGYDVHACPPNSYGVLLLLQLAGLSGIDLSKYPIDSAERLQALMVATKAAVAHADKFLADPEVIADRLPELLSPSAVAALQAAVRQATVTETKMPSSNGTAVISVADAKGNGVTIVQSIFVPFGAIVADAETGIVLNNRLLGFSTTPGHPNFAAPNKRPAHTLSPALVLRNGRLSMLLGTPGGMGQTITLSQVFTDLVDYGLDLKTAISLPRWALDIGNNIVVEPEIPAASITTIHSRGLDARTATPQQRFFFGSAECIDLRNGELIAVADGRRNATASAY
ncbi:MAG TPA: gamma-glutamyltransferase [Pseudolabrys sp.]|nr:gamma-glutamyltransferase [Pseudolabrys sp.]